MQPGAPASPDPLASLETSRRALEGSSDSWSTALDIATVIVVAGVIIELIVLVSETVDELRTGKPLAWRHMLAFAATGAVILGCAWEGIAEYKGGQIETKLRANNAAEQGILNARVETATKDAVDLANSFGGLTTFVHTKEHAADVQRQQFVRAATDQKTQMSESLTEAKKDAAGMDTALGQEKDLRNRYAKLIEPRVISDAQATTMAAALSKYTGQQYQVATYWNSKEPLDFANRVHQILQSSGWSYIPFEGWVGLLGGEEGVRVNIHPKASEKTHDAAKALVEALVSAGFQARLEILNDTGPPNERVNLTVGSKARE